jgi:hypothetical protein
MTSVSDYQKQVGEDLAAFELSMEKFRELEGQREKWLREISESKASEAAIAAEKGSDVEAQTEKLYRQQCKTRVLEGRKLSIDLAGEEAYQLATQICVTFSGLSCAFMVQSKDKCSVLGVDPAQLVDPSVSMPHVTPLEAFPPHERAVRRKRILENVASDLPQRIGRVAAMMKHLELVEQAKQPTKKA